MFYKYPYTNLYNLNLDWLIQAVKELQEIVEPLENVVTSVNGMTGNVELTREILTQILGGMVSKFNGRDGDVELTAEDVNSTLIDITWTSDPGDVIGDLTQTELDALYTSGKRVLIFVNNLGVADQVYFLQYYDNHAMPQEYSPTSALAGVATFNGQTGNVTVTGDDLETSGTDTRTIAESLEDLEETKVPVTRTVNNQSLSTNIFLNAANIPSQAITGAETVEMALGNLLNSKVPNAREVNGKSLLNDITLNDEDIPSSVDGQTTVEEVLNYQSQQIGDLTDLETTAKTDLVSATNELVENLDTVDATTRKMENVAVGETVLNPNQYIFLAWLGWSAMELRSANPSFPILLNPDHTYTVEIRDNLATIYDIVNGGSDNLVGKISTFTIESNGTISIKLSQASTIGNNHLCAFIGDITIKRAS